MKILHLTTALDFGGVERCLQVIAEEGIGGAEEHIFASLGSGGATERAISRTGSKVHCLDLEPSVYSLPTLYATYRFLLRLRPDVVHTHGCEANFHGLLAAWLARITVRVGEEIGIPEHRWKSRLIFRGVYRSAHAVVAVSEAVKRWLITSREVRPEKIAVIDNPVRLHESGMRQSTAIDGPIRIGFVGRLVREKNLLALLDALALVQRRGRSFQLIVVGEGPARWELEGKVRSLKLSPCVEFVGFQQTPAEWLRFCDVFVLPSCSEGFGLALVEAMALGLPALVTPVGIAEEVVHDGVSGWIAKSSEVADLAEKLDQALECPRSVLLQMGEMARAMVRSRYSPDRYMRELHCLYQSLCGAAGDQAERTLAGG